LLHVDNDGAHCIDAARIRPIFFSSHRPIGERLHGNGFNMDGLKPRDTAV